MPLWFCATDAPELGWQFDEALRQRFAAPMQQALQGEFDDWATSPRRRLALILLLDQFPRNLHRGTAAAYAGDPQALRLALGGMQLGADIALDPAERLFFYMPLQHAESREVQDESVTAFERLCGEAPQELRPQFAAVLDYARRHHEIIARFGRFPRRNVLLGRSDTPEERQWLQDGASSLPHQP